MAETRTQEDLNLYFDKASEILAVVKEALIANGITPPERSYVTIASDEGTAHDDSDQLTVSLGNITNHVPGGVGGYRSSGHSNTRIGVFYIELVRCVPGMISTKGGHKKQMPPLEKLQQYGKQRLQEYVVLKDVAIELTQSEYDPLGQVSFTIASGTESGQAQAIKVALQTMV